MNIIHPDSTIVQESAPFTLFGNRGYLHEGNRLVHPPRKAGWIYCRTFALTDPTFALTDPDEFMAPGQYTELFFLDEATALAAGHRPCGLCHHARSIDFYNAWKLAFRVDKVTVDDVDQVLRSDREMRASTGGTFANGVDGLMSGVMIRERGRTEPLLLFRFEHPKGKEQTCVYPWTSHGYGLKRDVPTGEIEVMTPSPIVKVIANGFKPGPEHPLLAW